MRLRRSCQHDRYDEHPWDDFGEVAVFTCPGGEFLPEDALVIEKVEGEWPDWALGRLRLWTLNPDVLLDGLAELIASQVGEPG